MSHSLIIKGNGSCDSSADGLVIECFLKVFCKALVNLRNAHGVMRNTRHGFACPSQQNLYEPTPSWLRYMVLEDERCHSRKVPCPVALWTLGN